MGSLEEAVHQAAISAADCMDREGAQRAAKKLLGTLKAICLGLLAAHGFPEELIKRLRLLPLLPASVGGKEAEPSDVTRVEREICAEFCEASQQLVKNYIQKLRRTC